MRLLLAVSTVFVFADAAAAQPAVAKGPDVPVVRYGQLYRPKAYPQASPKLALDSVVAAAEKNEYAYIAAHLIDPPFIDARVNARARQFEGAVEDELLALREQQQRFPDRVAPEARVPLEPVRFKAAVAEHARERAFRQVARDVADQMSENPEGLKDLKRCLRWGTFPDGKADAAFTLPIPDPREPTMPVKDRSVSFKKIEGRWYVENSQVSTAPAPAKVPELKKGP